MKRRCSKPDAPDYDRYGGRGITVCDAWRNSFEAFYQDVGDRPGDGYQLDRIDNNRGYEPGNVRWATLIEQANNKRTTRYVNYRGKQMSIADAARAAGGIVSRESARCRIVQFGWDVAEAVETPYSYRRDANGRKIAT